MDSKVYFFALCVFFVSIAVLEASPVKSDKMKPNQGNVPISGESVQMVRQRTGRQFGFGTGNAQAQASASASGQGFGGGYPGYGGYGGYGGYPGGYGYGK